MFAVTIGSPAMNFLPATVAEGAPQTALGAIRLTKRLRHALEDRALEAGGAPGEVIVGIQPEHFEDARLVEESKRSDGTFSAQIEVLESMGSDKYAYFSLWGNRATSKKLKELTADAGTADLSSSGTQITTRISAASTAAKGDEMEFWFDMEQVQVFDPTSGRNLTAS